MLDKYNIWDKIKETLNIKFHSMPVYDEKYITSQREFNGAIKTNFLGNKIPKESMHYTCITCITIDSVMRMEKKNYPQFYFRRMPIQNEKEKKWPNSWKLNQNQSKNLALTLNNCNIFLFTVILVKTKDGCFLL